MNSLEVRVYVATRIEMVLNPDYYEISAECIAIILDEHRMAMLRRLDDEAASTRLMLEALKAA